MENPRLIEPSAKHFLYSTLQKCHDNRVQLYTIALNVIVFILFVVILCVILYYCYKRKLSPEELQQKMLKEQQYILSKIRFYQNENIHKKTSDITNLPSL